MVDSESIERTSAEAWTDRGATFAPGGSKAKPPVSAVGATGLGGGEPVGELGSWGSSLKVLPALPRRLVLDLGCQVRDQ